MSSAKVSVVRCDGYEYEKVRAQVHEALRLLGGIESFVKPGMRVLVKPNLLRKSAPDAAITTHPSVVRAVLSEVREAGATAVIAESPGGAYGSAVLHTAYDSAGLTVAAEAEGAVLSYDTGSTMTYIPDALQAREIMLIDAVRECDAVISVAKLKTHELMMYTGAVKNLFGLVPGLHKAECHFRIPRCEDFAELLVDICEYVKPVLSVIDAVVGMEGEGPSAGKPVQVGAVIAGTDPHATDLAAVSMVGIAPESVYTLEAARGRGLVGSLCDVELSGEDIAAMKPEHFVMPASMQTHVIDGKLPRFMSEPVMHMLQTKPQIPKSKCVGCGVCERNCPAHAIVVRGGKANIDYKACINCYCCHELCPQKIVKIKQNALAKLAISIFG